MNFLQIYFQGLLLITLFFSIIWIISVKIKNASIVDIFWGMGYVILVWFYFVSTGPASLLRIFHLVLVTLWGFRLSGYIFFRNYGKEEDFRYQEFRKSYGTHRYWWVSFFQVFMLQGVLAWLISAPLLAFQFYGVNAEFDFIFVLGISVWFIGFIFEAGGDWQMANFKRNPKNKGKVLQTGFWKYTRHPNYFGDAAVWWGFAIFSISVGSYLPVLSSVLMTLLLLKVSGVSLLEKTLITTKPEYLAYMKSTNAFFPWFPKKQAA